jgi:hypothetical protein
MQTIDVPQRDWGRTLDEFSALHDGWIVSLDVLAPEIGAQPEIRQLPLRGVTADTDSHGAAITIAAALSDGEQITHIVHAPTHVRIERTNDGADVALQIESRDGAAAILRLTTVARPDTVDGVPQPR